MLLGPHLEVVGANAVATGWCRALRASILTTTWARFNSETLEVTVRGKTIDDVLNMSIEEGVRFFETEPALRKKIDVLNVTGTPEDVVRCKASHTGRFLKVHLRR